ncbi:Permease of the drug/metabolite transporter (DMT) superfamily [hydrothermal vent metagenome]|uniref:Permease of the drug/metabolite transporter (DMT) superfamily n=1 Tax=hydrothermal vent metagenome TaxID=652676 RepID=A0A3B0UIS0_9ZZZZ
MNKRKELLYYGAALLSMMFWSFSFVWVKIAYLAYKPITVVVFRLAISAVTLFLFAKVIGRLQQPSKKDFLWLLLMAFFEPFLYFMGESFGLLYISSTEAAVIIATIPLFSPILAWYFYKEKLSWMNSLGLIISFAGVALVVLNKTFGVSASPKGILLEFLAVFAAVGYATVLKHIATRYNALTIIAYQNFLGVLMFLPLWLATDLNDFINTPFHARAFQAIILLSVFASSLAFMFFTYSMRHIGINRTNTFVNAIPVFVAVFAYLILGDELSLQKMIGIAVVIAGLFMAQIKKRIWYSA